MSNDDVLAELRSESLLNRVRRQMFGAANEIDQALRQRNPPTPINVRRLEFGAARDVIELVTAEERARIRRELLMAIDFATLRPEREGAPVQDATLLEIEIRGALDRICPEDQNGTSSPSTTSST